MSIHAHIRRTVGAAAVTGALLVIVGLLMLAVIVLTIRMIPVEPLPQCAPGQVLTRVGKGWKCQ